MLGGKSGTRLGSVLRQPPVKFFNAQALRRAGGETLQAAFGPKLLPLGLERFEVPVSHPSFPFSGFVVRILATLVIASLHAVREQSGRG
jgi:hypothetical protein